ncbi:FMN-dependent NADH-azoreductase [Xylanibacillus composti]|uniref:FMN dependent NADH:quinone oxidoreductase n=1 Tax=Xylanibacillus composti TaxID=1572762 RepID=A0A8J4H7A4_9BACL|nr:FMN-dependent NADH-azoreductase [Xylanibacillus composti]MDT9724027.1 FMN-dependent NADH-azoreductase [Xylanibacillus composti]GIQ71067.1 FMN-dependent NADH-azoreductase 2 [Xylanibacillus composti]
MAKLLYVTVNPKPAEESYGLTVGQAFLSAYRQAAPEDEIEVLDLYQADIPFIDTDVFSGWGKLQQGQAFDDLSPDEKSKVARINELTDQFIAADKYVFVTPMWNFSFPPKLKVYMDNICIAGKTFRYTAEGPVGLLHNRKALHIQARGGIYSEGPAKEMEFGDRYLRALLAFVGVTEVTSLFVEGMAQMPGQAEQIKEKAIARAAEMAKSFALQTVPVE